VRPRAWIDGRRATLAAGGQPSEPRRARLVCCVDGDAALIDTRAAADHAAEVMLQRAGRAPRVGLICGTGFASCTDVLEDRVRIPFAELEFRDSAIPSHVNEVDIGELDGVTVAAVKAKSLPCDGATWQESGLPARSLSRAGCTTLLYSANSGSMREDVRPGSFLAFTDHINFSGINPLADEREGKGWATPYLSMADLYDAALRDGCRDAAANAGVTVHSGVAGYWMGPSFETPAEIRLAQAAGCAISSNSFLPEVMAGYHAGLDVVAFSFVSTMSAGLGPPIDLAPVLDLTRQAHDDYRTILRAAVPVLARHEGRHG
jgi:inosine/guanosine/xanthosine phosphorylase family protein